MWGQGADALTSPAAAAAAEVDIRPKASTSAPQQRRCSSPDIRHTPPASPAAAVGQKCELQHADVPFSPAQQLQQPQQPASEGAASPAPAAAAATAIGQQGRNSRLSTTAVAASMLAALVRRSPKPQHQQQPTAVAAAVTHAAAEHGAVAKANVAAAHGTAQDDEVETTTRQHQQRQQQQQDQEAKVSRGVHSPRAAGNAGLSAKQAAAGSPATSHGTGTGVQSGAAAAQHPTPAADSATAQSNPAPAAAAAAAAHECPLPGGYQLLDYDSISDAEDHLCDLLSADNLHGPDEQLERLQEAVAALSGLQEAHQKLIRFRKDYKWVQEWVKRRKAVKIVAAVDRLLDNALKQD